MDKYCVCLQNINKIYFSLDFDVGMFQKFVDFICQQ